MQLAIYAKAIVLNDAGEVLVLRRSASDTYRPGEYDFPGGRVETGEDLTAAVIREIREETGLNVPAKDVQLLYAATTAYKDDNLSVNRLLFRAHVQEAAIRLSPEHDKSTWLDVDAALGAFHYAFYSDGLKYAQEHSLL